MSDLIIKIKRNGEWFRIKIYLHGKLISDTEYYSNKDYAVLEKVCTMLKSSVEVNRMVR